MTILLLAFMFAIGALALFAYAFWTHEPAVASVERKGLPLPLDLNEPGSKKLELQLNSLEEEINKLSSQHALLKEQLELAKSIEYGLKEDLADVKQLKNGWTGESDKIINKEIDLERELAKSASLIQEMKLKIDKFKSPDQDNREMIDRIVSLEAKISEYKLAIEEQAKETESKSISEDEYNNLKKQLGQQEEILRKYKQDNEDMNKEYDALKKELQEKEETLSKLSQSEGVSPEEYKRLKERLQQAEEVLRIIHAEK